MRRKSREREGMEGKRRIRGKKENQTGKRYGDGERGGGGGRHEPPDNTRHCPVCISDE